MEHPREGAAFHSQRGTDVTDFIRQGRTALPEYKEISP